MNEYRKFADELALKAGKIMLEHFGLGVNRNFKHDTSPVTEADLQINSRVIEEVKKAFPEHSVQGEEETHIVENSEYVWVCDPVDGTRPFSNGLPIATFSLALVKDGEVIVGVVYDPFCDRLYSAEKGGGCFINNIKTHVSETSSFVRATADCEISPRAKYDTKGLRDHLVEKFDIVNYKLCAFVLPSALVSAGEFDFTIFPATTAHDAAAIKILVEEAGGKVTDIFGEEQRYDQPINGLIVSNGILHDELVAMCKEQVKES